MQSQENIDSFSMTSVLVNGETDSNGRECDIWLLRASVETSSTRAMQSALETRACSDHIFTYRILTMKELGLGFTNNQLCLYIDGRREEQIPKVAIIFLPAQLLLTPHMLHAVRHLEAMGVRCVNSSTALSICRNKVHQLQLVVSQGVPVPDTVTYAVSTSPGLANILSQPHNINFPAILKHPAGSKGQRVMLVPSKETVEDIAHSLMDDDVYMLQHYVRDSHGMTIRALVIGDKVHRLFRSQNLSNARVQSNVSMGGQWAPMESDPELENLALKVTRILGLDLAGVDFVEDGQGQKLYLESNSCPCLLWGEGTVDAVIDYCTGLICRSSTTIKLGSRSS